MDFKVNLNGLSIPIIGSNLIKKYTSATPDAKFQVFMVNLGYKLLRFYEKSAVKFWKTTNELF